MSVIRPRPPSDPVHHVVERRGPLAEGGPAADHYREWLSRAEAVRSDVASGEASGTASAILAAYGTLGAFARRTESGLFAILERARLVREAVDLVVVVGDRADRAVVDLLVATCCHPFHDLLPRHERGGRPRIVTLDPGDDDDRIQGVVDLVGITSGDRVCDAWLPLAAGPCREGEAGEILALLEAAWRRGRAGGAGAGVVGAEREVPTIGGGAPWSALLAAAIVGVDVVRFLEGAAAMERRFRESAAEANPVLTAAAVGPSLGAAGQGEAAPRRRLLAPAHWQGLVAWHDVLVGGHATGASGERFDTTLAVEAFRRAPFGQRRRPAPDLCRATGSAADRIDLPRADEHTIGQVLALLILENEVARRLG